MGKYNQEAEVILPTGAGFSQELTPQVRLLPFPPTKEENLDVLEIPLIPPDVRAPESQR